MPLERLIPDIFVDQYVSAFLATITKKCDDVPMTHKAQCIYFRMKFCRPLYTCFF